MGKSSRATKILFALAGNMCSMPGCNRRLVEEGAQGHYVVGVMAHIKGERPRATRYDPNMTTAQRQAPENLILLCPNHHTEIDKNPGEWPVERLKGIKAKHERLVATGDLKPKMTEFEGKVRVEVSGGDSAVGVKTTRPTRFRAGTEITVASERTRKTTGLQIGEDDE